MSVETNTIREVSLYRASIEDLIDRYRTEVGAGKMDRAAKTIIDAFELLLDLVEPPQERKVFSVEVDAPPEVVKEKIEELKGELTNGVCAPCDVTNPNNPALIEDFKSLTGTVGQAPESIDYCITVSDPEAAAAIEKEIIPVLAAEIEAEKTDKAIAPAPKTPKKPKAST